MEQPYRPPTPDGAPDDTPYAPPEAPPAPRPTVPPAPGERIQVTGVPVVEVRAEGTAVPLAAAAGGPMETGVPILPEGPAAGEAERHRVYARNDQTDAAQTAAPAAPVEDEEILYVRVAPDPPPAPPEETPNVAAEVTEEDMRDMVNALRAEVSELEALAKDGQATPAQLELLQTMRNSLQQVEGGLRGMITARELEEAKERERRREEEAAQARDGTDEAAQGVNEEVRRTVQEYQQLNVEQLVANLATAERALEALSSAPVEVAAESVAQQAGSTPDQQLQSLSQLEHCMEEVERGIEICDSVLQELRSQPFSEAISKQIQQVEATARELRLSLARAKVTKEHMNTQLESRMPEEDSN